MSQKLFPDSSAPAYVDQLRLSPFPLLQWSTQSHPRDWSHSSGNKETACWYWLWLTVSPQSCGEVLRSVPYPSERQELFSALASVLQSQMQLGLQGLVIRHRFPWRNAREITTYDPIVYDPNAQCESVYKPGFPVSLNKWRFRPHIIQPVCYGRTNSFSVEIVLHFYRHGFFFFLSQTLDCESTLSRYETLWRIFTLKETTKYQFVEFRKQVIKRLPRKENKRLRKERNNTFNLKKRPINRQFFINEFAPNLVPLLAYVCICHATHF